MSVQPGGSTLHIQRWRKSVLFLISSSVINHGSCGRSANTASEKGWWGTSCSNKRTLFSVSLSPIWPRADTKWPCGNRDERGQESILTTILWPSSVGPWRVSIRILGILWLAGTKVWCVPRMSGSGNNVPQYVFQLRLTMPTTLPVICKLDSFTATGFKILSSTFSTTVSSASLSVTTPLGRDHSVSGRISMATVSPCTARFRFCKPCIRTHLSMPSISIEILPSR